MISMTISIGFVVYFELKSVKRKVIKAIRTIGIESKNHRFV